MATSSTFTPAILSPSLWLEADDLTTLYQTITATTPVAADGDVVGTWQDKSGNGFHVTAQANDTTRPIWHTGGGLGWVTFDGSNDILYRAGDLGTYAAVAAGGGQSTFAALKAAPSAGSLVFVAHAKNVASLGPVYDFRSASTGANGNVFVRDDSNTTITPSINGGVGWPNMFNNANSVVGYTDASGTMTGYIDGTASFQGTYTPGTLTIDRFGLGGLMRAAPAALINIERLYALVVVNRVLSAPERASLVTYLGAKAGLSL